MKLLKNYKLLDKNKSKKTKRKCVIVFVRFL